MSQPGLVAVLRGARAAIVFLTRVPAGGFPYVDREWRWAAAWFPLVGALVGAVAAAAWTLARPAGDLAAAVVAVAAAALFTGGLHEDGLADTADALGGGRDRARVFAILKDSRIGSYGATALVLSLVLRAALIARLGAAAAAALVLVGAVSRLAPVWLMAVMPYVTPDAVARSGAVARTGRWQAFLATVLTAVIAVALAAVGLVDRSAVLLCAPVALAAAGLLGWRFFRRVGGVTGDFLGATQQLTECALLLTLAST